MSIVRALSRVVDRLTGVLGYDCNGRRLRRGDVVEPAPGLSDHEVDPRARCQMTVHRRGEPADLPVWGMTQIELLAINPEGDLIAVRRACNLRKVTAPALGASWENVERLTGWAPSTIKRREDEEVTS